MKDKLLYQLIHIKQLTEEAIDQLKENSTEGYDPDAYLFQWIANGNELDRKEGRK